jgi:Protein of unknown function (DUF2947)
MIPVQDSFYSEYFERAKEKTIFLLNEEEAKCVWGNKIDRSSSSYFDLPDDCWLVANESISVGRWIEAYNSDDNVEFAGKLRAAVSWSDDTIIQFLAKNKIIFQAKWCDFLECWDEFIAAEDDCPIVIPQSNDVQEALLFRPIGDVLKIG